MIMRSIRVHACGRSLVLCFHNNHKASSRALSVLPSDAPSQSRDRQIKRAKEQLDSFHHAAAASNERHLITEINNSLTKGFVKPLFHTLFLPETFLNNHRSSAKVTAGQVDEERSLTLDFYGRNLDDAVIADKNGKKRGANFVTDNRLGETWNFDLKQTVFALNLVNTDAEMLGEDIECTKLTSPPIEINSKDVKFQLLTRPESRGVVADIFHQFAQEPDEGSVAAITGSPGIGKSWTLFYALQQALLYDGANVMFFFQKVGLVVMYLRRNNKVYAWTSKSRNAADSNLFSRTDVLVLLDPEEARKRGADFLLGRIKLLFAASNNEGHFRNAAAKENGDMQAFLGPPLDTELDVILRHLDSTLTPDVIEERKQNVGNLIRYILKESIFNNRVAAISKAVEECAGDNTLFEKALLAEGMSDGQQTIPGTLFQVLPTRPTSPSDPGYDGQNVLYRKRKILAVNDIVSDAILMANRKVILSYWGKVSNDEYSKMGNKVERLFIKDLTNSDGLVVKRYLQTSTKAVKDSNKEIILIVGSDTSSKKESILVIEKDMVVQRDVKLDEVCAAVLLQANVVSNAAERGQLIDAAGPGRKVYQVTVSPGHRLPLEAMAQLGRELGFIDQDTTTKTTMEKLEFHWVVPIEAASKWKNKAPFRYRSSEDQARNTLVQLVNRFLARHVDQYVLPMTYKHPITFVEWSDGEKPW